jgi:DNA-binding response OmpR family regulator
MAKRVAKRILVVDDHAPTRSFVRSVLEAEKSEAYDVVEAATGTECLKLFDSSGPFDLIVLDVGLPDIDGYAVCKGLRNVDKQVPIVFVTARSEMQDFMLGRESGGDSYIVKPIARGALRSMVTLFTSVGRKKPERGADSA